MSTLKSKSPAEFFAEHQNIAGFDNPGKSLYTTIREFVENSLDAAEACGNLPDIVLTVESLDTKAFNTLRGVGDRQRKDESLYLDDRSKTKAKKKEDPLLTSSQSTLSFGAVSSTSSTSSTPTVSAAVTSTEEKEDESGKPSYFRVTCRDNGMGMPHDKIPQMLGVVLSSTKYGVKQTRGKFGLGAKMALVWSKKSTGFPIEVWSAISPNKPISYCKLDIDIYKNQPRIIQHEQKPNTENWRGTEIKVIIGGKWTSYRAKVVNYLRQLAVITPYAQLRMNYVDPASEKKSFSLLFQRRTDVMPPIATEMKHHPSSVDNLLVEQLIHMSKFKTLKQFLKNDFSSISNSLADRLIGELGSEFSPDMKIHDLKKKEIHQLTQLLREAKFSAPDPACLSPAGEYNLRLGIMKELQPDLVATASIPPEVYEGHPFVVEAAVSLGGARARPGISVYRFANRIPLLFEGGNDVVSVVANKEIKWAAYKVGKQDKVGVFVSIVSTKIPFKGTSKEYIGDDKGVLHKAIKKAISNCCVQLRKRIVTNQALRSRADRKRQLSKYIPDVSRALIGVLNMMSEEDGAILFGPKSKRSRYMDQLSDSSSSSSSSALFPKLNLRPEESKLADELITAVRIGELDEDTLEEKLQVHVDQIDAELALEYVTSSGKEAGPAEKIFLGLINKDSLSNTIFHSDFKFALTDEQR